MYSQSHITHNMNPYIYILALFLVLSEHEHVYSRRAWYLSRVIVQPITCTHSTFGVYNIPPPHPNSYM